MSEYGAKAVLMNICPRPESWSNIIRVVVIILLFL